MNKEIKNIVLSGLFLAIGIILPPLLGGSVLGQVISPIHFPVLLCGLLLGWKYGLIVGIITPIFVSVMWGNLPMVPLALIMSVECAAYGFFSGFIFEKVKLFRTAIGNLYFSLLISMIIGRIVYLLLFGIMLLAGFNGQPFGAYVTAVFVTSIPGIILQILTIPPIVLVIDNNGKGIA